MGRLAGKVALITGASRGIGAGLALAFAREGADIILNYRANDAAANSVAEQIQAMGRKVLKVKADVSQRDDIKAMLEESKKVFGRVDILVNNAGINQRGWFEEVTDEAWDLILGTNLKGPFICCQEIFPLMKQTVVAASSISPRWPDSITGLKPCITRYPKPD